MSVQRYGEALGECVLLDVAWATSPMQSLRPVETAKFVSLLPG